MSRVFIPNQKTCIASASSVVGKKENDGNLFGRFDIVDETDRFGKSTFEQSESEMQRLAVFKAIEKANLQIQDIDAVFSGDLTNQCAASNYAISNLPFSHFGLYGACSTFVESMVLGAMAVGNNSLDCVLSVTSSHNCTAERQFRFPLEYGSIRTPTSQWTVTGSGAVIIKRGFDKPTIADCMIGKIVDGGITDINNMGAAMAPAAIDTLTRYFEATNTQPQDFDFIFTGDLGFEGHRIVTELMGEKGYDMTQNYGDCGLMIFDRKNQDVHAGGSGAGCSAVVFASHIYPCLCENKLNNILFLGTGALMNPLTVQQGLSIPGIAHLVHLKGVDIDGTNN